MATKKTSGKTAEVLTYESSVSLAKQGAWWRGPATRRQVC